MTHQEINVSYFLVGVIVVVGYEKKKTNLTQPLIAGQSFVSPRVVVIGFLLLFHTIPYSHSTLPIVSSFLRLEVEIESKGI